MTERVEYGARWDHIMQWFDARGGEHQATLADLSFELGIPNRSLRRILVRMADLNVLEVTARWRGFAEGREPNRYRLLVSPQEWRERGQAIVKAREREAQRERRNASRRARYAEKRTPVIGDLTAPDPEVARRAKAAAAEAVAPDLTDAEIDAWLAGSG